MLEIRMFIEHIYIDIFTVEDDALYTNIRWLVPAETDHPTNRMDLKYR